LKFIKNSFVRLGDKINCVTLNAKLLKKHIL